MASEGLTQFKAIMQTLRRQREWEEVEVGGRRRRGREREERKGEGGVGGEE